MTQGTDFDSTIYKTAFRETENPAIITDAQFVVRDVNDACIEFTGYDRDELVGETPLALFNEPDVYTEMAETLTNGEPWVGGFETTTKDGRVVYGRGSCAPIYAEGELHGYAGFFMDLTERRQYERSLRILNRVLRHNLRNDANVVLGHIDMVAEAVDDPNHLESLATARERVESILSYAETARDLDGLLSSGDPSLRPVVVNDVVREELRHVRERFPEAEFVNQLGPEPAVAAADDAVGKVLEAILVNAVEHNDEESPRVAVRVDYGIEDVTVEVADNGPGVPEADRDLIFGREEDGPLHHGQGLTLFFVDRLMEKYGGDVWVEDNDPKGAVFKLRFRSTEEVA